MRTTGYCGEMVGNLRPHCWSEIFGDGKNAKEPANLSSANELDEVKKDLRNAREENLKLQAVITDVTEVNKRWQKYNNDRQMYVDKLLSTIQNQQEQMNTNIEKRLQMSKEGDDCIDLTRQLRTENAKLRDEVGQLKRRMESMEREHKEHVEVLEIQVKANKDDWEAEKREKELARQEKEKLEKLAEELQEEINLLKLKYSCHHSTMGQRRPSSCGSAGCHFIYGEDGRESHCSSHIMICRKNSFPAHRTSMHVPCASGHLLPRGSLVYLDDDLVIDGDSEKIKPALELNVPIQLRSRSNSMENLIPPSNEEKKPFSESQVKSDLNRFKDSAADSVEKCVLDIPSTNGVTQSRSASTFSSASSLSLASGGCRLEGSLLNIKDMAASSSSNSLVSSSAKALPPLPTSYSDTVVPDQVHKPALDSRWSTRISASPFKININHQEATNVVDVNPQSSSTMLPNITAEPSNEECPEDGTLTQTREDVICPGCGRVFHPEIHLQFLKHFGECQNKNKANKSTLKSRN